MITEIHLLSLRGKNTDLKGTGGIVRLITKGMLKRNKVSYDKLVLVQTKKEKLEYIKYYNPQILFEDQPPILNAVPKSIRRICILSKHNENEDFQEGTICISDYEESRADIVSIVDKAVTARNRKDIKTMAVDLVQLCAKSIGKWYFLMKFKPIIYGAGNIPSNGSVIFAGNHRNKLDPVFISISSGKSIHWAALLRMFQGKESLFHADSGKLRRVMSAKFITAMGALPIARPTDENNMEINLKTIKQLKNLLNMGAAVGFFPEGTINRKPEDVNILPLRSNRVFRMAKETDSYIQPFSIVWIPKELGGKNRLVIKYSKPINPYNRSSREIGELWKETVEEGIIQR